MKKLFWIFGIGILINFAFGVSGGHFEAAGFGLAGLCIGIIYLFLSLIMLIASDKDLAGWFLLSGLLIFLIGATTCSTATGGMSHI
jgi:hypothetical protein